MNCACGCGRKVSKEKNRFICGHTWKGKKNIDLSKKLKGKCLSPETQFKKGQKGTYYSRNKKARLEYDIKYYRENKEKIKLRKRKYYQKNSKQILERLKEYRKKNKERINKWKRKYYKENREKILRQGREQYKRYYAKHSIRKRQKTSLWAKNNPQKTRLMEQQRYARKANVLHLFSNKEWLEKLKESKGFCYGYNKKPHWVGISALALDHIFPISKAEQERPYFIKDIQPLCKPCNSSKRSNI